jgi:hypothetical protein
MDGTGYSASAAAEQVALRRGWSPDLWVMLQPAAAYKWLAGLAAGRGKWIALRRPLFIAFLLGCMISLLTSQSLALRLVADGAINASFILLGQIFALAVVRGRERTVPFSRAIDLFFAGYGPWSLWILVYSALWAFASPLQASTWAGSRAMFWAAAPVALWSGYVDYCFFRCVLQRSPERAARALLLQWAISWSLTIWIFGGGPLWSEHMRMAGR